MYCRYCGNDIGASGRFCQFCGKPREELSQDILPEEIPVPEILPQVPPEIPVEENLPEEKTKKQSRGLIKLNVFALIEYKKLDLKMGHLPTLIIGD